MKGVYALRCGALASCSARTPPDALVSRHIGSQRAGNPSTLRRWRDARRVTGRCILANLRPNHPEEANP
jgi:hypothetical protein